MCTGVLASCLASQLSTLASCSLETFIGVQSFIRDNDSRSFGSCRGEVQNLGPPCNADNDVSDSGSSEVGSDAAWRWTACM